MPREITRQELVEDYKRLAEELGGAPTKRQYNNHGEYSEAVIYKHFDSIGGLKECIGHERGQVKINSEDLITDLRRVAKRVGRVPPIEKYDQFGDFDTKTLKSRFGNWCDVLETAGFQPTDHSKNWQDNDPNPHGDEVTIVVECSWCGKDTEVRAYDAQRSDDSFCGNECQAKYMAAQSGPDTNAWKGGKVTYECEICGEVCEVPRARAESARYCSYECVGKVHQEERSGPDSPRWKGGYDRYYGPNWREQRRRARERDSHCCRLCEMDSETHKEKFDSDLPVHHIKRFGDFEDYNIANQLENLVTLCRPHHSKVECGEATLPDDVRQRFINWHATV